jgi:hypothetical protein
MGVTLNAPRHKSDYSSLEDYISAGDITKVSKKRI